MSYAVIDQTIRDWAAANVKTLFLDSAGAEARFCYLSSPHGECYQISIGQPENERVSVRVHAIETIDDMEGHLEWIVPIARLRDARLTAEYRQAIVAPAREPRGYGQSRGRSLERC